MTYKIIQVLKTLIAGLKDSSEDFLYNLNKFSELLDEIVHGLCTKSRDTYSDDNSLKIEHERLLKLVNELSVTWAESVICSEQKSILLKSQDPDNEDHVVSERPLTTISEKRKETFAIQELASSGKSICSLISPEDPKGKRVQGPVDCKESRSIHAPDSCRVDGSEQLHSS